jgi:hypothetical protein
MIAEQLKEMMANWNKTEAVAREAYPDANDEEIYQMTARSLSKSLGL